MALKVMPGNVNLSAFESELVKVENALEILDNPNHHKMMRKELTMNIFPFGNDGTDPSLIIKLVRFEKKNILIINIYRKYSYIIIIHNN